MKKTIKQAAEQMKSSAKDFSIAQPTILSVCMEVEGTSALIQNHFSQKAVEEMLRKHMGLSVQKEKKNPRQCVQDATILNVGGRVCIPPTAFKNAMLAAATQTKTLKKTQLRIALFIEGQSVPITYSEMVPRMDMVRTAGINRTPDVRFRPMFEGWKARLSIQFSDTLSVESVVDLLNRAGSVGVGEWRPEKNGTFGTFRVTRNITDAAEIAEVREQCSVPLVPLKIPTWALDMDIDPQALSAMFRDAVADARESTETNGVSAHV